MMECGRNLEVGKDGKFRTECKHNENQEQGIKNCKNRDLLRTFSLRLSQFSNERSTTRKPFHSEKTRTVNGKMNCEGI